MGHAEGMYIGLLVVAVAASLAWRWPAVKGWAEGLPGGRTVRPGCSSACCSWRSAWFRC